MIFLEREMRSGEREEAKVLTRVSVGAWFLRTQGESRKSGDNDTAATALN